MARKAPGKSHRKGISVMQMAQMFATEDDAVAWFEDLHWPDGQMTCLRCGSADGAYRVKSGKPMPYRCKDCKRYFSLKTGTAMEDSKLPLRIWAWAIYLEMTSLQGVSSMKLHRDLGIRQATAWHLLHRIREAFAGLWMMFDGPVEADEAYFGGLRRNMSNKRRKELEGTGRGPVGKTAVVGIKDRATKRVAAQIVDSTDKDTLQIVVAEHVAGDDVPVYTDATSTYKGLADPHETVKHSAQEYVRYLKGEKVHTNGVESFWSMLKRAHKGVYHKLSAKHLQRYVSQFAGRQNLRELDTIAQMQHVAMGMVGRRLTYRALVAPNGPSRVAG